MDSAVIGPLLSVGFVAAIGLRWTFAVTFLPGIIAALLIALLVRERQHIPQAHEEVAATIGTLPYRFKRFLIGVGIAGCGDFSNTLLILWATQAWRPTYGAAR